MTNAREKPKPCGLPRPAERKTMSEKTMREFVDRFGKQFLPLPDARWGSYIKESYDLFNELARRMDALSDDSKHHGDFIAELKQRVADIQSANRGFNMRLENHQVRLHDIEQWKKRGGSDERNPATKPEGVYVKPGMRVWHSDRERWHTVRPQVKMHLYPNIIDVWNDDGTDNCAHKAYLTYNDQPVLGYEEDE